MLYMFDRKSAVLMWLTYVLRHYMIRPQETKALMWVYPALIISIILKFDQNKLKDFLNFRYVMNMLPKKGGSFMSWYVNKNLQQLYRRRKAGEGKKVEKLCSFNLVCLIGNWNAVFWLPRLLTCLTKQITTWLQHSLSWRRIPNCCILFSINCFWHSSFHKWDSI